jgi:hypothetical protein
VQFLADYAYSVAISSRVSLRAAVFCRSKPISCLIPSSPFRYWATQHLVHKQARVRVTTSGTTTTLDASVMFYGASIPASPFEVNVLPSRTCAGLSVVADGGGIDSSHSLSIATAGLTTGFSITVRDLYSNLNVLMSDNFKIKLSGASFAAGIIVPQSKGVYLATYTATVSGVHFLAITSADGTHFGSSPYTVYVQPAVRSFYHSNISLVTLMTAGGQMSFTVTVRDRFGNYQPNSAVASKLSFSASVGYNVQTTDCLLISSAHCPSFLSGSLIANPPSLDNPRYIVRVLATRSGRFSLAVLGLDRFDTAVGGSPFFIAVQPLPVCGTVSIVTGVLAPFSFTRGTVAQFTVSTLDVYGNNRSLADSETLEVFDRAPILNSFYDVLSSGLLGTGPDYIINFMPKMSSSIYPAIVAGGVHATMYYPYNSYNSPLHFTANTMDFSIAAGGTYRGVTGEFALRFEGFFKATHAGSHTFRISEKSVPNGYWTIAIDDLQFLSVNGNGNGAYDSGVLFSSRFQPNRLYNVLVTYRCAAAAGGTACTTSADRGLSFEVQTSLSSQTPLNSIHLRTIFPIAQSPYTLNLQSDVASPFSTRQSLSNSLTVATCGAQSSFVITSKDKFSQTRTTGGDMFSFAIMMGGSVPVAVSSSTSFFAQDSYSDGGVDVAVGYVTDLRNGVYRVVLNAVNSSGGCQSGVLRLVGRLTQEGGLNGNYFETENVQDNSLTSGSSANTQDTYFQKDETINFDWGANKPVDVSALPSFNTKAIGHDLFSVRWTGYVKSPFTETFTFTAKLQGGIRLFIDNLLIIDRWTSFSRVAQGTVALVAVEMHAIRVEYRHWTGNASVSLSWSSASLLQEIIPSQRLYSVTTIGALSTQNFYVAPGPAHSSSTIYGAGVTIATAGVPAYFTVNTLDRYGNQRLVSDSPNHAQVRITPLGLSASGQVPVYRAQLSGLSTGTLLTSKVYNAAAFGLPGGFTATYYASSSFSSPIVVSCQNSAYLASLGCSGVSLTASVSGSSTISVIGLSQFSGPNLSIRWRGWFLPTATAAYRFFLGKSALATTLASMSITGFPNSLTSNAAASPSITFSLVYNQFYEVVMDYSQTTAVLDLKLHYAVEAPGSPATAFSSALPLVPTTNMYPLSGRYAVMYTPAIKGDYTVSAGFAVAGALEATFYDDRSLSRAISVVAHTSVDLSCAALPGSGFRNALLDYGWGANSNVTDYSSFAVRWQGFFKPTSSVTTFGVTVKESDERFRLWIDNTLILNYWQSAPPAAVAVFATFSLVSNEVDGVRLSDVNSLYDVKLEYSQFGGQSGITVPLLTAANIFTHNTAVSPLTLSVQPATVCSTKCTVNGFGLTKATAGEVSTFSILAADRYNNAVHSSSANFIVRLEPVVCVVSDSGTCPRPFGTVEYISDNLYSASYTATVRGSYDIYTFILGLASSLTATYYSAALASTGTAISTGFKYSAAMTLPGATYSVRYAGFIQPPLSGTLTVSFAWSTGTHQVTIFLNRLMTAAAGPSSQAGSLSATVAIPLSNAFYDIRIDFSTSAAYSGVHDFAWKYASSWEPVPTSRMFARHDVIANAGFSTAAPKVALSGTAYGPASIILSPGATCADQSIINGVGVSVATAGSPAVFSVTSRDAYGNDRALNEDIWTVVMDGAARMQFTAYPDTRPLSMNTYSAATYPSLTGPGRYTVPYMATVAGTYQVSVFRYANAGLALEVFSDSGMRLAPTFSCSDASVDYEWGSGAMAPYCAENPSDFASDFVSMRWSGFVLLDVVETVTFFVETAPKSAGIDGARLWVGGILMVDSTIANEIERGAFNVTAASLYSVLLEYRATTG